MTKLTEQKVKKVKKDIDRKKELKKIAEEDKKLLKKLE